MEQKSSAALVVLKQIVNRTIEQISHLDKFALRDVSVGHPVVNRLSGYSQLLRKGFHGKNNGDISRIEMMLNRNSPPKNFQPFRLKVRTMGQGLW